MVDTRYVIVFLKNQSSDAALNLGPFGSQHNKISVDLMKKSIQVVHLELKQKTYHRQLQVIIGLVALMESKLTRNISNKQTMLYQNIIQENVGCITLDRQVVVLKWKSIYMSCAQQLLIFHLLKSHFSVNSKGTSTQVNWVKGVMMAEIPATNPL